ncbi:MAG: glycosyltransferase [Ammonifex sp.]|nr:MAG: glycosyltransferase [Ammonifex sp.]
MRILHYFLGPQPLHGGGLLKYAHDLAVEQRNQGHEVFLLMPGYHGFPGSRTRVAFFDHLDGLPVHQIVNPNPVSIGLGIREPRAFMCEFNKKLFVDYLSLARPDIIHVHSLIGLPKELLVAAKVVNIPVVFTAHDYFGICPTVNLWRYDNKICNNPLDFRTCQVCNERAPRASYLKLVRNWAYVKYGLRRTPKILKALTGGAKFARQILGRSGKEHSTNADIVNEMVKCDHSGHYAILSDYYFSILKMFDTIICGSSVSLETYESYFAMRKEKANITVVPLTHMEIRDNRTRIDYRPLFDGRVHFAYMGYLNNIKGFFRLIETFENLKALYDNWQLHIYGDYSGINTSVYDREHYFFHGKYSYKDLDGIFSNSSTLIVPSDCRETYSFVALEAFSYGIPVLLSSTVGFKDRIVNKKTGIVFGRDSECDLRDVLIRVLSEPQTLVKFHENILADKEFDDLLMSKHWGKMQQVYQEALESITNGKEGMVACVYPSPKSSTELS